MTWEQQAALSQSCTLPQPHACVTAHSVLAPIAPQCKGRAGLPTKPLWQHSLESPARADALAISATLLVCQVGVLDFWTHTEGTEETGPKGAPEG